MVSEGLSAPDLLGSVLHCIPQVRPWDFRSACRTRPARVPRVSPLSCAVSNLWCSVCLRTSVGSWRRKRSRSWWCFMLHVSAFLLCTQAGQSDSGWGRCGCEGDGTLAPGLPLEHLGLPSCCAHPVSLPAPLSFVCAFSSGPAPPSTPVFLSLALASFCPLPPASAQGASAFPALCLLWPEALGWTLCSRWSRASALACSLWLPLLTIQSLASLGAATHPAGRSEGSGPGRKGPLLGSSLYMRLKVVRTAEGSLRQWAEDLGSNSNCVINELGDLGQVLTALCLSFHFWEGRKGLDPSCGFHTFDCICSMSIFYTAALYTVSI